MDELAKGKSMEKILRK
ncbi:DUF2200 domain-containing protein [Geobacillus thermodenitrificans]|uniref:DUF2200 domain-containing protein n=1 Tax=Geobacillus thermodenitrificans TaxID=33940 RepID=A0ABY9QIA2_GEOTD|nr:DUF2200 domain-containing protein [Geobacillus thermodenitrificans]WMV77966.1 DUF2200 domain-containing protein [Geobacillus thermodenitrificans]